MMQSFAKPVRAVHPPPLPRPVRVQRAAPSHRGNQAVLHQLSAAQPRLQAKLQIGAANDPLEHEADQVAESVMRMAAPSTLRRKCGACEEADNKQTLQTKRADPQAAAPAEAPAAVHDVLRQPGEKLDTATRAYFEPRFGIDFGAVRIHHAAAAPRAAQSVGARAFTAGENIVFAHGEFAPASVPGRQLLAHELAHVVQQRGGAATGRVQRDPPKDDAPKASGIPEKICDPPQGPGKHPSAISKEMLDRMMGKSAAKDGDPGEGCIPTPYPAGNGETVCTIGFGHQITTGCPTLSIATGNAPSAAEVADANAMKQRDGDKADAKPRKLRPAEWLTCGCKGKTFDCKGSEAENQLTADARVKAAYVDKVVPVDLTQAQYDALVDLSLHRGSLNYLLLDAIKRYWCTAEGRNYVRELYLQADLVPQGEKQESKGFIKRRQLRVWPVEG
jgi:GH24 family phage-related lysozyme (muramidase)